MSKFLKSSRLCIIAGASAAGMAACSGPSAPPAVAGPGQPIRMEQFCAVKGLAVPLRQTYVILDDAMLKSAKTPEEFAARNGVARSVVLAIGDPAAAVDQGVTAARERVTVLLTSPEGAAPRQLFTGCLPALSKEDREQIAESESGLENFFTGGSDQSFKDAADRFRTALVGSLIATARAQADQDATGGSFLQSLGSATIDFGGDRETVPRLVLVTNVFASDTGEDVVAARKAGFEEAQRLNMKLGFSEIAIVGAGSGAEASREWARSLLLGMGGNLHSWSSDGGSIKSSPVPVEIRRFSGQVVYPVSPAYEEMVQIRLGVDANQRLTHSWMVAIGEQTSGVPMEGGGTCSADGRCEFRSDVSAQFAQLWVPERQGSEPNFESVKFVPYGALRQWRLSVSGSELKGEIFDPAVDQIGPDPKAKYLSVSAVLQPEANF